MSLSTMNQSFIDLCVKVIIAEEGFSAKPYYCTEQYATIGYGRLLSPVRKFPLPNITTTKEQERFWLENRIKTNINELIRAFPVFNTLSSVRKVVLVSMVYQLGINRISKFTEMWKAIKVGNYDKAGIEMLDSLAAKQTPNRFKRNFEMFTKDVMLPYYGV